MRPHSQSHPLVNHLATAAARAVCAVAVSVGLATGQATEIDSGTAQFNVILYETRYGPPIGLTEGSPGIFYGNGGSQPVAFSVTTQGVQTILTTFPTSDHLTGLLVSAENNRFYSGVSLSPNAASVFSVTSVPGEILYPAERLSPAFTQNLPDGMLLGLAGNATNWYLVKSSLEGVLTLIYQFPTGESLPHTAVYARDGNYYGVSMLQDASGYVYRVTPSGSLTKLYTFPSQTFTFGPRYVPLLEGRDGNLYGATPYGGTNGTGIIYKVTLAGQYTLLYTFPSGAEYHPNAMIEGSDGNLYVASGLTGSASLLFRITKTGKYTLLHAMRNVGADGGCQCQLTLGSDGIIYGTALYGGVTGGGDIFALNAGLPIPKPRALHFTPQSGPAGTVVRIWGYDLLSASVQFNGVSATTVSNAGPNYVFATVPVGATTGPISITTPGGSVTTRATFTVQ